jgi:hypothetical protein
MGSDPLYFAATAVFRMTQKPRVIGGLAMMYGYARAWLQRTPQLDDPELRAFIRSYQRQALVKGKAGAIAAIEARQLPHWAPASQTLTSQNSEHIGVQ